MRTNTSMLILFIVYIVSLSTTVSALPLRCLVAAQHRNTICVSPWATGLPKTVPAVWYYDGTGGCATDNRTVLSNSEQCQCDNGANAFGSRLDCEQTCGGRNRLPAVSRCSERYARGFRCACNRPGLFAYYNSSRNACDTGIFDGCGHTANWFATVAECRALCIDADNRLPPSCGTLADDTLPVLSAWDRSEYEHATVWNYEANGTECVENKAVPIVDAWPGEHCLADNNQFSSRYDCEQTCRVPRAQPSAARCSERRHRGVRCTCAPGAAASGGRQRRYWYYEGEVGRCRPLRYRGCGGNGNRFAEEAQCTRLCVNGTSTPGPKTITTPAPLSSAAVYSYYGGTERHTRTSTLMPVLIYIIGVWRL